ncbi:hypothetical protein [Halorubrum laminariae]|uniref:Uncharacterized protein n=1 Tax=Halorubrum laminariae TaxID=1433523 RepID=A0ABD6BYD7_9EURY|nr:hypothetical protein [Halorubrum laminariae]
MDDVPTDHGIPGPSTLSVSRADSGGIALSAAARIDPFIWAANSVPIRR